jgi:hypothetical protein
MVSEKYSLVKQNFAKVLESGQFQNPVVQKDYDSGTAACEIGSILVTQGINQADDGV